MSYSQQPGQPEPGHPDQSPQQPYGGQVPPQYGGAPQQGDPGTLDLPHYGIGFADAVKRAFQKYARFDGRASRSEFWWFALFNFIVFLVLEIPLVAATAAESGAATGIFAALLVVYGLAVLVPGIAIGMRRLHDGGFSGWLMLLYFVPIASIVLIVLWILPSKPEGAKYDRASGAAPDGYAG